MLELKGPVIIILHTLFSLLENIYSEYVPYRWSQKELVSILCKSAMKLCIFAAPSFYV